MSYIAFFCILSRDNNCDRNEHSGLLNGKDFLYIIESVDSISRDERDSP